MSSEGHILVFYFVFACLFCPEAQQKKTKEAWG
jgi:hypothetical protein